MAMADEAPVMMPALMVDPPVMAVHLPALPVDQLMTTQLAAKSMSHLTALWVLAEKPEVSDEFEGYGLLLQRKKRALVIDKICEDQLSSQLLFLFSAQAYSNHESMTT